MPNSLQDLIQNLSPAGLRWSAAIASLAGVLVLFFLFRIPLRRWRQEREIARAVKRLGAQVLHNVHLPDSMGGEVMIEHLVLATDAIVLVGVKRYEGLIFGAGHTEQWTQVINSRSYRFANPDDYLKQQISAVRTLVPRVPVRGLHLFTHNAVFPKDLPPSVLLLEDIRKHPTRPKMKDIPGELRAAWSVLRDSLSSGRPV